MFKKSLSFTAREIEISVNNAVEKDFLIGNYWSVNMVKILGSSINQQYCIALKEV